MKYNKKIIFIVVGLVLVLITAVTTVFAAPDDNKEAVPMNTEPFTCTDDVIDTTQEVEIFQSSFGIEITDKNREISIVVNPDKLNGVEFGVYLTYLGETGSFSDKLVTTLNSSNYEFLYEYPDQSGDYIIELIMTSTGDTGCEVGTTNWTTTLSVEGTTSTINQYYEDNACKIIRGENVTPSENYAFLTNYNKLSDPSKLLESAGVNEVVLCTQQHLNTFGVSREAFLANITNIVNNLYLTQSMPTSTSTNDYNSFLNDLITSGYTEVTDPSKEDGIILSCRAFEGLTGQSGLPSDAVPSDFENQGDVGGDKGTWDTDYYTSVNQGKFYHINEEESKNGLCKKTCAEAVTVSYGPPVATKGGICFEYKVKVVAKMVCKTEIDYSKKPQFEPACNPTPVCNSTAKYKDQGGPAEDFDACIVEKDGGEYTQDAIDDCYNEVYGYDDELANDMSLVTDYNINGTPMLASHLVIGGTAINSTSATQIMNEVNAINSAGQGGKYVVDGSKIVWRCEGAYCGDGSNSYFNLGAYYFSSPTKAFQTIYNLNGLDYGSYTADLQGGYIIKSGGFKAAVYCSDSCSWTGCSTSDTLNNSEAVDDYNRRLADWNTEIQSCLGEATCNTITSEYTMQVNIEDGDKKGEADIEYGNPATDTSTNPFETDVNINPTNPGDENMIIDNGACYGNGATSNKYMTEWTYPHTYINNKNGDISYEKPEDTTGWREEENKFCLPLDEPDVNTLWFDWYINNMVRNPISGVLEARDEGLGSLDLTDEEKANITSADKLEYNIFANTTNFGEYSWNIDIQCFYASKATNPECVGDNCVENVSEDLDVENDTVNNYKYRSITLENINQEDADLVGFNWSEDAANYNNGSYVVDPLVTRNNIADRGSSIYEGDEYLDYYFVLTTSDLEEIRTFNEGKSYLDYGNNSDDDFFVDEESGITFYVSDFLRNYLDNAENIVPNSNNACNNLLNKSSCEREGF